MRVFVAHIPNTIFRPRSQQAADNRRHECEYSILLYASPSFAPRAHQIVRSQVSTRLYPPCPAKENPPQAVPAFASFSASAFFAHPPHAHLPASHGQLPSAPPQLQAVLPAVPSTLCSCASAAEVVVVDTSGFLAQSPQPHLPGSQGQEPVSPPQEQAVLLVFGMGWMFMLDIVAIIVWVL